MRTLLRAGPRRDGCVPATARWRTALRDGFHDTATVYTIAADHREVGLDATDVAIMDVAERVAAAITAAAPIEQEPAGRSVV